MYSGIPRTAAIVSNTPKAVDPLGNPDRQAFPGELINQRHQPYLAAIVGPGLHKVIGPDMVAPLRSQPDAEAVIEP